MNQKNKRILVTGGAGFLGSHLCTRLVKEGHDVLCLDNLYTGSMEHINPLLDCGNFEMICRDVIDPVSLDSLKIDTLDEIYHLACPASPPHYQADPIKTGKTSVLGALNLLTLAKDSKARILLASTSEVYGDPEIHPQPETYRGCVNTMGIRSCYDEGKRMAETFFHDFHQAHQVEIKVMRIFNTYGPNMNPKDGRVVSNFIMQALQQEEITIYGEGTQTRSFCYVDDLIEGMVRLMNSPASFIWPCNIGNPREFTILELAEKVIAMTNSTSSLVFHPLPQDDPTQRKPVIDVAKAQLQWSPEISLEEGLVKTIAYFQEKIKTS